MTYFFKNANALITFPFVLVLILCPGLACSENSKIDSLLMELKTPITRSYLEVEKEIWLEWSKSGNKNLDDLLVRGRLYMQSGRLDDAIYILNQIIEKDPEFAEAWNARATTFYMKGDFKNSIADIDQVLLLNANHFGALSGLGAMLENLGHLKVALDAFKKASEINPLNPNISSSVKRLIQITKGTSL